MNNTTGHSLLRCEQLGFAHKHQEPILQGINLNLNEGASYGFLGPSGCGKSTLLGLLADILKPSQGKVCYQGGLKKEQTSLVLQNYGLFPWMSVAENLDLAVKLRKSKGFIDKEALLDELSIDHLLDRWPHELSGGQQQRVAIARALMINPRLLLMDEPFSAVDSITREKLQDMLWNLWREYGFTLVLVTHDISEAVFLCNQIHILSESPAVVKKTIQNPNHLSIWDRNSHEYFSLCSQVRLAMEV